MMLSSDFSQIVEENNNSDPCSILRILISFKGKRNSSPICFFNVLYSLDSTRSGDFVAKLYAEFSVNLKVSNGAHSYYLQSRIK